MRVNWLATFCILLVCSLIADTASPRKRRPTSRKRKKTPLKKPKTGDVSPSRTRPKSSKTVDPDIFLEKFGYLQKLPGSVQHTDQARREGVKHFQRMYNIPVTGRLDSQTRRMMAAPRCGMKDMIPGGELPDDVMFDPSVLKANNFFTPGYKWGKKSLTWTVLSYSRDMDSGRQRLAFHEAFKDWSKVSGLKFQEVGGGKADIEIKFGYGAHGDSPGNEFDGAGGILAHAFYPEDGSSHFDESETWTEGRNEGTNLRIVAAHEFGHALGLGHSNVRGALMAPYYQGYEKDFKLRPDDIQAIQSLYGRPETPTARPTRRPRPRPTPRPRSRPTPRPRPRPTSRPPPRKPSAPRRPSRLPDPCTVKFNAAYQAHDGRTYAFSGKWVWRLNDWELDHGFPKSMASVYQKPPYNIQAAVYSWRTRYTYFFKGNKVFKYYGFQRIEAKTIRDRGFPKSPNTALMGRDGVIYLLKGAYYYVFDEYKMTVPDTRRRSIASKWRGVPSNSESAVTLRDGHSYFFKGSRYRKYDWYYRRVLPGYPKEKAGPWMGPRCGGRYVPK